MTDRGNDRGTPEELPFEELMAQSSVGGDTDPALNGACTDAEAEAFAATYSRNQAVSGPVRRTTDRNQAKQLVSVGVGGATVEEAFASMRREIDAVEYTRPPAVLSADATEIFARLKSAAFSELVRSSMAGDHEAVSTLFTWIRPAIVRYCRSRIGPDRRDDYTSADDVAQEICMAVLGALARYDDAPETFLPFVYGIAAHKVADHCRRTRHDRPTPAADTPASLDDTPSPQQLPMAADLRDRLTALLNTMPPPDREVLVLRLVVGLSAQETAAAVGLTPTAVRVIQHRALAELRNTLSPADWI